MWGGMFWSRGFQVASLVQTGTAVTKSHGLRAFSQSWRREVQDQGTSRSGVWRASFWLCPDVAKGASKLSRASFRRTLITFMMRIPPKASPLRPSPRGFGTQRVPCGCTNLQTVGCRLPTTQWPRLFSCIKRGTQSLFMGWVGGSLSQDPAA